MLKANNIRNTNYRLQSNDIYIGSEFKPKGLDRGLIVPSKNCTPDEFKDHVKANRDFYTVELDYLKSCYLSDNVYALLGWDVRYCKVLIELINELLEPRATVNYKELPTEGLTVCQAKAIETYKNFLSGNDRTMLLTGGGGVGKSYLMSTMIAMVDNKAIILSPKHKIKKLHNDKDCLDNTTIQSFLSIRPNYRKVDKITGRIPYEVINEKKSLIKVNESTIGCAVIFIDECSMIEEQVYGYLLNFIPSHIKIVFVGDAAQIKPLGENTSLTITNSDVVATLDTMVRYSGDLLEFCTKIRTEILSDANKYSFYGNLQTSNMITKLSNSVKALDVFQSAFNKKIDIRILTYTNNSMEHYNSVLNDLLFESQLKDNYQFFVGQKLIANAKSDLYKPISRLEYRETEKSESYITKVLLDKFDEIAVIDVDIAEDYLLSDLNDREDALFSHYDLLVDVYGLNYESKKIVESNFVDLCNTKFYWSFITGITEDNKEVELRVIYKDCENDYFKLVDLYKSEKLWLTANFILSMNDWLQPALCLTVDNSQGSTYQEIILDSSGIANKRNINRYYVGISRAKEKLYIV